MERKSQLWFSLEKCKILEKVQQNNETHPPLCSMKKLCYKVFNTNLEYEKQDMFVFIKNTKYSMKFQFSFIKCKKGYQP